MLRNPIKYIRIQNIFGGARFAREKWHATYVKNKLARIFKIFVTLFSRDCGNFRSTKFVLPFWNDQ